MLVTEEAFDQSLPDEFPWSGGFRASPRVDWGPVEACNDGYLDFGVLPSCRQYFPPIPPFDLEASYGFIGDVTPSTTSVRPVPVRFIIDPYAPGGTRMLTEEEAAVTPSPGGGSPEGGSAASTPCKEGFFTDAQCEIKLVPTLGVIGGVFLLTFLAVRRFR